MVHKTLGHIPDLLMYMDDFCVLSATWENRSKYLEGMFATLQATGLTLKPSKLAFGPKSVAYLGHVISAEGEAVRKDRIKAIQELPTPICVKDLRSTPICVKDLRSVLGVMNFLRRFVPNFSEVTAPLVDLTRKESETGHDELVTERTAFTQITRFIRVKQYFFTQKNNDSCCSWFRHLGRVR